MTLLRRFSLGLLLAPLLLGRPAAAQLPDPSFSAPTSLYAPGTIYTLGPQQADGKRLVSGLFSRINGTELVSRLVRFDAAGVLDQSFLQNVGSASVVSRIVGLPNGQYLLSGSGNYVTAGGFNRAELLRLNANGTADATFDAGTGPSGSGGYGYGQALAVQPDGKVLVVGYFDSFNGVPALGVVRLNPNGSVDTGFTVGTGIDLNKGPANAVAVQPDGKILVGGNFSTFNGRPASGLVRLNANGSVDASFRSGLQPGSEISGLVLQPDGKVLANGYLTVNNSANTILGLVRLLPEGALDGSFAVPAYLNNAVMTGYDDPAVLLQPDGKILVIGYFNGAGANYVTRLNANGTQDASFQTGNSLNGFPYTIGLQANGSIILGGNFNSLNGSETPLGRLTSTGAPDAGFVPKVQIAGSVSALVLQPDGKLMLGGNFTELNGQPVHHLARLAATGALEAGFSAATGTLPGPVGALALQADGKVLAGTARGLLRLAGSGSPDPTFTSSLNTANITALALQADGRVLVGGFFSVTSAGTPYSRLARLTGTGSLDPTFARNTSGSVGPGSLNNTDAIVVQPDGRIVVGGTFRVINQPAAARVVRYEATGALDASFTPPLLDNPNSTNGQPSRVYGLAVQPDGKILASGSFAAVNGVSQSGATRLTTTGALDASFAANASIRGIVFALARQPNGRVLLSGSFTSTAPTAALSNLSRMLDSGQADDSFGPSTTPNGAVRALVMQPDGAILLAGNFTTVGGQPNVGVARIVAANVLAVAAPAAVAARTAAWPVPAHGLLHVAPDARAQPLTIELLDALGRAVRAQPATTAAEISLNLEALPAGMYLLRVRYAAGAVTRRIAVQ